jgi:WhiB family redox-sensing transcriptional regulator
VASILRPFSRPAPVSPQQTNRCNELKENDVFTAQGWPQATTDVTCRTVASTTRTKEIAKVLPCRAGDPDLWFAESPVQLEQAKALCATCPIRKGCLSAAMDRREPWGVWGGEIFDQGVVIARKRPRGRPRKVAVPA